MESRFAFLHQRDTSVSMLRVKMSRRRSQSQKENRTKVHNLRRQLEDLQEQDMSMLEKSIAVHEEKVAKTKALKPVEVNSAVEERKKMLARYKEAKELQKEKERREKEKKGVFKCGLYQHTQPAFSNSQAPSKAKNPEPVLTTRVTRSMKQPQQTPLQPLQQKIATQKSAPKKEPVVRRPLSTRGQTRVPPVAATTAVTKPKAAAAESVTRSTRPTRAAAAAKPTSDLKTRSNSKTRSTVKQQKVPSAGQETEPKDPKEMLQSNEKKEEESCPVDPPAPQSETAPEKDPVQTEAEAEAPSSFAPEGFVFQAPVGLLMLQPAPPSPGSASAITAPSFEAQQEADVPMDPPSAPSSPPPASSPSPPPAAPSSPPSILASSIPPVCSASPPPVSSSSSSSSPPCSDAAATAAATAAADCGSAAPPSDQQEEQHDVPYFRAVMVSETQRLTEFSEQWQVHFEDSSIPEEMRDRMRTAVGQARLLMKERFGQFSGLVDDCEFGRGEKVTTCTDLQGFWDMVYYQVEDVDRKFKALKEAEGRGWTEESKPAPRQRKVVKKPPTAGAASRPATGAAGNTAAKGRLAAIKAAMKAKQQQAEAEKAAQAAASVPDSTPAAGTPSKLKPADIVVFNGGFFQVESPLKTAGTPRPSRVSATPTASPLMTPSRHRRSALPAHASPFARATPVTTPARLPNPSPARTPQPSIPPASSSASSSSHSADPTSMALSFSPERSCPAALSRLSPQAPDADRSPRSTSEVAPSPHPSLLVSSPAAEQRLPTVECHASPAGAVSVLADVDMSATPETSCTETPDVLGLDFERYLQPTARVSLSPSAPSETFSPMAVDAEMESPEVERPDALVQTPTALPRMSPLFTPQMEQSDESNLLLFTPVELKNSVPRALCEDDLMCFTPPSHN
ncbi:disks large-associated protein 5 isoform X4 [Sardina pilchardus]|uniref:disks large-associated protein 5 isoform X4 n=1 Tax=Sardina pilchardus TaxID=27697 RepID=UPI002E1515A1